MRKCHDCGSIAEHESDIRPGVLCKKCGSQDTRKIKTPDFVKPEPDESGTAFPASVPGMSCTTAGLSKREWFAGMALTGLISQVNMPNELYAKMAVSIADEMLKRLEAAP